MDPYLEHPARWPDVHPTLITYAREALNDILPPQYVAEIGERLYVVQPERSIYPDFFVSERLVPPTPIPQSSGGTAVAVATDPPWVLTILPVEVREVFIQILPVADESRIVSVIEVLSPSNKATGSDGRELLLKKQAELLHSETHLIEIDFLRYGEHTVAAPRGALLARGRWDYLVSLHRGGQVGEYEVWAIPLRQRLPRIRVPLTEGDPDVALDLQAVFDRCYDAGGFARRIDFRQDPPSPLSAEDAEWAAALLREKSLRA
jgi:hypothetical protein